MHTPAPIRAALIYGSVRDGRFCDTVARWAAARLGARTRLRPAAIDPATYGFGRQRPEARGGAADLRRRVAAADAFVVVTPEYNHGYTAALKQLIDSVHQPWHAKPVAFVAYGGQSGGLRAVEQLRQVFAELHAVTVRTTVSFINAWDRFDAAGRLRNPARAERTMSSMLDELEWWADALRDARHARPFDQVTA